MPFLSFHWLSPLCVRPFYLIASHHYNHMVQRPKLPFTFITEAFLYFPQQSLRNVHIWEHLFFCSSVQWLSPLLPSHLSHIIASPQWQPWCRTPPPPPADWWLDSNMAWELKLMSSLEILNVGPTCSNWRWDKGRGEAEEKEPHQLQLERGCEPPPPEIAPENSNSQLSIKTLFHQCLKCLKCS